MRGYIDRCLNGREATRGHVTCDFDASVDTFSTLNNSR